MSVMTAVTTRCADWGPASARVTALRRNRFVEFQFQLGDADLAVEMVLPYEALLEFCELHNVELQPVDDALAAALRQLGAQRPA